MDRVTILSMQLFRNNIMLVVLGNSTVFILLWWSVSEMLLVGKDRHLVMVRVAGLAF